MNTDVDTILANVWNYDTRDEPTIKCLTHSYTFNTYNKGEFGLRCSSLIGAAPAIMDASVELATYLGNDQKYATHIQNQMNNKT